jgi:hypothetical protein
MSDTQSMEPVTEVTTGEIVFTDMPTGNLYPALTNLPETSTETCDACGPAVYAVYLVTFLSKENKELELALCRHHTRTLGFGTMWPNQENRQQGSDH